MANIRDEMQNSKYHNRRPSLEDDAYRSALTRLKLRALQTDRVFAVATLDPPKRHRGANRQLMQAAKVDMEQDSPLRRLVLSAVAWIIFGDDQLNVLAYSDVAETFSLLRLLESSGRRVCQLMRRIGRAGRNDSAIETYHATKNDQISLLRHLVGDERLRSDFEPGRESRSMLSDYPNGQRRELKTHLRRKKCGRIFLTRTMALSRPCTSSVTLASDF